MYALWVCQENIERFGRMLATEPDPRERGILTDLMGREASRLEQLKSGIQAERRARARANPAAAEVERVVGPTSIFDAAKHWTVRLRRGQLICSEDDPATGFTASTRAA